jgi:rhodanese-related sulfurtransferase
MNGIKFKPTVLILLIALISSCTAIYEDGKDMASVAKRDVKQMTVDSLESLIENGEAFLLIDVRQPADYEAGNITGSFSIPRGELEFLITDEYFWEEQFMYVPLHEDLIIVYCKAGDRGILAAQALQKLGFTNVLNLEGGYTAYAGDEAPATVKVETGGCGG